VGGIPALLGADRGILIEPGSAEEVAHGIRRTLGDPDAARQRAGRLKRHVDEYYDADRNARALIELYREVAAPLEGQTVQV
jgi:glycosyltransferase involved in cell wall biosynthesis